MVAFRLVEFETESRPNASPAKIAMERIDCEILDCIIESEFGDYYLKENL